MLEYSKPLLYSELFTVLEGIGNQVPLPEDGNDSEEGLKVQL